MFPLVIKKVNTFTGRIVLIKVENALSWSVIFRVLEPEV